MGKIFVFLTMLLAIGLLAGGAYVMRTTVHVPPSVSHAIPTLHTLTISEETATYAIDVQYPQFGIPAVDAHIQTVLENMLTEFRAYPPLPSESAAGKNAFVGRFDKSYVGPDIISVELILSTDTGGAHPMTLFSGMAFDRSTGKRLELADALELTGKTVADVSASSTDFFDKKFGEAFFREGADTNPENYSSFTVSMDAVTFVFQQYQVAAYAAGPQEVRFVRVR